MPTSNFRYTTRKGQITRTEITEFDGRISALAVDTNDTSRLAWDEDYTTTCSACRAEQDHTLAYHNLHKVIAISC